MFSRLEVLVLFFLLFQQYTIFLLYTKDNRPCVQRIYLPTKRTVHFHDPKIQVNHYNEYIHPNDRSDHQISSR